MKGSSHALVGGVVGGVTSIVVGNDPIGIETGILVGVGVVAGLVPDLDTNGKLSGKMTISHKFMKTLTMLVGIIMALISILQGVGVEKLYGVGIGLGMVFISRYITQRRMLTLTGIGVIVLGVLLSKLWLLLFGVYIFAASFMGHRTYTHSLLGLAYFGYIAHLISIEFSGVTGLFAVLMLGYISHLVCDTKAFNKQGVKLFRPLLDIEF